MKSLQNHSLRQLWKLLLFSIILTVGMQNGYLVFAADSTVAAVSAGYDTTAIVSTDGTLYVCGSFYDDDSEKYLIKDGQVDCPVQVMSGVRYASAGYKYIAILKTDGTLWMCGENSCGRLGDGTNMKHSTPVQVMSGVKDVSTGEDHTAILKTDGTLWMCGYNGGGQLGDGTDTNRYTPVQIMSGVKSVSVGSLYTAILKTDGTLWMCGFNNIGQFGDGTNDSSSTPVLVMSGVKAVSCGSSNTAILKTDGSLWMCGNNEYGQLGVGTDNIFYNTPVQIMSGVKDVSAGYEFTAILKTDGTLWMCGRNDCGQLGDGTLTGRSTPVQIMSGVKSVSPGYNHTGILKTDGTLWMCGYGYHGQIGAGETRKGYNTTPVKISLSNSNDIPTETQTEAQTEVQTEAQTEVQTETQTETQTEAQTETQTEAQTEAPTVTPANTPTTYKITFNPNGGKIAKGSKKTKTVTNGKAYGTLPKATRSGYKFLGWYTAKKGGSEIKKTTKVDLSKDKTFYAHFVKPISIKKATIKVASCTYNSRAQKPTVTVTYKKKELKQGTDYTVSYKNNKNASKKAVVVVKGEGLYKDIVAKFFTIKPLSLTNKKVFISLEQTTIPTSKKSSIPPYTAYINLGTGKTSLKKGTDFTASISVNLKSGKGKVVFKGKGNYTGSKEFTVSVSDLTLNPEFTVSAKIKKSGTTETGKYSDNYFADSNVNNKNLLKISCLGAASTYGGEGSAEEFLKDCGFSNVGTTYTGSKSEGTKKDNDHCTLYFGTKKINIYVNGKKVSKNIIAILINGYSGDGYEWISNFNLGKKSDVHQGFNNAAIEAYNFIKNKYGSSISKSIVWISGHSRGAAVTNLLAYKIDRHFPGSEIFAYGFATPNVSKLSGMTSAKLRVVNVINKGDFVPYVPLEKWGFSKPGQTVYFTADSATSLSVSEREKLIKSFNECCFGNQAGFYIPRPSVSVSVRTIGAKPIAVKPITVKAHTYMSKGLAMAMNKNENNKKLGIAKMVDYSIRDLQYANLTAFFVVKETFNKKIIGAHDMSTYLKYVNRM